MLLSATICRDAAGRPWASAALAARDADGALLRADAAFEDAWSDPARLGLRLGGGAVVATGERLSVDLGPAARLEAEVRAPRPWARRALGGLGLAHLVPGLTQYWHPHLLGGRAEGRAELGGRALRLDGLHAYGEKNWGRGGAPPAWWWGQTFAEGGEVAVAFAGGVLLLGPGRAAATALAVRAGDRLLALAPPLAAVRARVGGGAWRVDARSARHRVRVEGEAHDAPLVLPVPVPAQRRTEPRSHQHQDGRLEVAVWRGRRLVLRAGGPLAGLEAGGALTGAVGSA